jgi:hypothetical protein
MPRVRIGAIHAFVAIGSDDEEGIVGGMGRDGTWMPFIAADETRLRNLTPQAEVVAAATGKTIRLVRFSERVDIGIIEPGESLKVNDGVTITPEMDSFKIALEENIQGITKSAFLMQIYHPSMDNFREEPWPVIQLAIALLQDKPIVLWRVEDRVIPSKLAAIADLVIEGDLKDPKNMETFKAFLVEHGLEPKEDSGTQPKGEPSEGPQNHASA